MRRFVSSWLSFAAGCGGGAGWGVPQGGENRDGLSARRPIRGGDPSSLLEVWTCSVQLGAEERSGRGVFGLRPAPLDHLHILLTFEAMDLMKGSVAGSYELGALKVTLDPSQVASMY